MSEVTVVQRGAIMPAAGNDDQELLRELFDAAAAKSLVVLAYEDAEPEMARFLQAVKAHPEERAFVVAFFEESFSDSFYMRSAPAELLEFCMHDLRWPEVRNLILSLWQEDARKRGAASACRGWAPLLDAFEDNWQKASYYKEYTKKEIGEKRTPLSEEARPMPAGTNGNQTLLQRLFDLAAAKSLAVLSYEDAEPEMAAFLHAVKAHPEERAFVIGLFEQSFSESFYMRDLPRELIEFCMHDLRWPEIRNLILSLWEKDARQPEAASSSRLWASLLQAFEDDWEKAEYFKEYSGVGKKRG